MMRINGIPGADKVLHLIAGALCAVGVVALVWLTVHVSIGAAMIAGAAALGVGYELVQKMRGEGVPDWRDAVATAAGGVIVAALSAWPGVVS